MNTKLRDIGRKYAKESLEVLATCERGECECGASGFNVDGTSLEFGVEFTCLRCWVDEIQEWEDRNSCSSEYIFNKEFNEPLNDSSHVYREVMTAYWDTLTNACPICCVPAYEWKAGACECWLCDCMTTNPEKASECRHCGKAYR